MAALNGAVTYVNRAGRLLVGLDESADVQRTSILEYVPAEDRQRLLTRILPIVMASGHWHGEGLLKHFKTG